MNALAPDTWRRLLRRRTGRRRPVAAIWPAAGLTHRADGCYVLGRLAQSLDGRIATVSGASHWISGQEDIVHTHRLRALFDAVVIGAGTVRADDPQLTTREVEGPSPVRVVLDTNRRLDARLSRVPRGTGDPAAVRRRCPRTRSRWPRAGAASAACARRIWTSSPCSRRWPNADCGACSSRAAASPFRASLPPGALDRLHVTIAPLLIGSGIPAFTLAAGDDTDRRAALGLVGAPDRRGSAGRYPAGARATRRARMTEARAFWTIAPERGEIRSEVLRGRAEDVLVRTLASGVSRGTEALVFAGRVPASQYQAMRAPLMGGDFPFPVKYGYSAVGRIDGWRAGLRAASASGCFPRARRDVHRRARQRADAARGARRQHGDRAQRDLGCRAACRRAHAGDRRRRGRSADCVAAGAHSRRARHRGGHRPRAASLWRDGSAAASQRRPRRQPSRS